jgi:O-antigen ligase
MNIDIIKKSTKSLIWICLGVILFSPLYVNTHLFFPFIVTKAIAFNVSVEVMFLAFLFLSFKDKNYHIRINTIVILMGVYVVLSFISSLLGDNFYRSFWSNNERSEGLLLMLHLFMFLIVLSGFFRKFKDWLNIFDLSFIAGLLVALFALGQHFNLNFIMASSGGSRLAGTLGNSGYMAGYLLFAIFFGLLLLFKRKNKYLKLYYTVGIILSIFVALFTYTRGGYVSLFVTGFLLSVYLSFFYYKNKIAKVIGVIIILLAIISPLLLFSNKNSDFVKSSEVLNRITSISTQSTTAQTRLMTWNSSLQGFKERPILGWGQENFYQVFDKYFNPQIYDLVDIIWYDRAHSIIFDRLVTGGLLGLVSYLSLLFIPLVYFWRHFIKQEGNQTKYFLPTVFSLVVLAYFIQNNFIFEALVTYIPLFLVIGFVGLFSPHYSPEFLNNNKFKQSIFIVFIILFLPTVYFFNIKPLSANIALVEVLSGKRGNAIEERFTLIQSVMDRDTYGNQEYRQQYATFFSNVMNQYGRTDDQNVHKILSESANNLEKELQKQVEENPHSVMNYLLLMKFNNMAYIYNLDRLNNNVGLFEEAIKLSPSRAHIYYEIGDTYIRIGGYFNQADDKEKATASLATAVGYFKQVLNLNPESIEAHQRLVNALMIARMNEEVIEYASRAKNLPKYGDNTWADEAIKQVSGE